MPALAPADAASSPVPSSSNPLSLDALSRLAAEHVEQRALCDMLEAIADMLPRMPERRRCLEALEMLERHLPMHHADEELGLFPLLKARCGPEDRIEAILAELEDEHVDDEALLTEVVLTLRALAADRGPEREPAIAGYVLRGFFESQRRHIAWEEATIMPLALERLRSCDLAALGEAMADNRRGARPDVFMRRGCDGSCGRFETVDLAMS